MNPTNKHLPLVDAVKALASQLIVWHHLAFYGPMSDVAYPLAPDLLDWLYDYGRIAVQAFLVVGGFLAARSLAPRPDAAPIDAIGARLWRRYLRLARPYAVALPAAVACAWLARSLIDHPTIPQAPTATQAIAHVFLLQDIVGVEALSAGVWYLAIDFQLYALLLFLLWSAQRLPAAIRGSAWPALLLCVGLTGASLFWLNLDPDLDEWAPYFFGAYGLGVLAQWLSTQPRKAWWSLALGVAIVVALAVEWRSRILVAGIVALLLAWGAEHALRPALGAPLAFLSRISFPVFLIHYPVCLAVGAVVYRLWPGSATINALGMIAAWLLSLWTATLLQRAVEPPSQRA